jgi:hypothetical protein
MNLQNLHKDKKLLFGEAKIKMVTWLIAKRNAVPTFMGLRGKTQMFLWLHG